jgi:hypothetical protein
MFDFEQQNQVTLLDFEQKKELMKQMSMNHDKMAKEFHKKKDAFENELQDQQVRLLFVFCIFFVITPLCGQKKG